MKSNLLLLIPAFVLTLSSCTKEADESAGISDATLSSMTSSEDLVLARTTHNEDGDWQIKMNSAAAKAFSEGKVFPPNAMIVKEKLDANGKVLRYAVMYNAPGDKNSVDNWLWSEFDADRHVVYSSGERAANCQSCHSGAARFHQ